METSYQATYKATQKLKKNGNTLLDNFLLSPFAWAENVRTWIPMALPTLTNHCFTTVPGKRRSREITYQAPSQPTLHV